MMDSSNKMLTLGFGPMLTYTNFKVQIRSSTFDSQELRLGVVADLGYMHRFSDFAIKLDGKYYYEKTDYYGFLLSFLVHTR